MVESEVFKFRGRNCYYIYIGQAELELKVGCTEPTPNWKQCLVQECKQKCVRGKWITNIKEG